MINIKKKDLFLIAAIFVFLAGVGMIISPDSTAFDPTIHGHPVAEIEGLQAQIDAALAGLQTQATTAITNLQAQATSTISSLTAQFSQLNSDFEAKKATLPSTNLVRHGLGVAVSCPTDKGWVQLWAGYSVASQKTVNGIAGEQDLGSTGSCLSTDKATVTYLKYANSQEFQITSTCVVCEKQAPILVRHGLGVAVSCPTDKGWTQTLWTGYSVGGAQDLGSTGSCLSTDKATVSYLMYPSPSGYQTKSTCVVCSK